MAVNLFFIPHQDDEALTFGAAIRNHLDAGHECHVILYTDGAASSVRKQLNGEMKSGIDKKVHDPATEGYASMEEEDFARYRNDEFNRSCLALGVPPTHIHYSRNLMRDGTTTVESCEQVILEFMDRFPGARVKTFTYLGGNHPDHANMGQAARNLLEKGLIADLRFYVEPYNLKNAKKADRSKLIHKEYSVTNKQMVIDSISEYKKWNPSMQQFAIGYHSVKRSIDDAIADPVSYYHKPNNEA